MQLITAQALHLHRLLKTFHQPWRQVMKTKIFPYIHFCVTIYYKIALWNLYLPITTKLFEQKVNEVGKTTDFNKEQKKVIEGSEGVMCGSLS